MTNELSPQSDAGGGRELAASSPPTTRSIISSIGETIRASYDPRPLAKPTVDPHLATLPAIERVAEVCRYTLAKLEYSLSAGGGLRAWFKLNLLIAVLLAIPALLVLPVITLVLGTFASWAEFLAVIASHLLSATMAVVATAAVITSALFAFRLLRVFSIWFRHNYESSQRRDTARHKHHLR